MNIYIIITIILSLLVIGLGYLVFTLNNRVSKLLRGKKATTLEDSIHAIVDELENIHQKIRLHDDKLKQHDMRISNSIKTVPTVRFNPFADSGGNQSFASAFISEQGNGVVVSSLYSREKTSVFAKPIQNFESQYELTKEEKIVLEEAKKQ